MCDTTYEKISLDFARTSNYMAFTFLNIIVPVLHLLHSTGAALFQPIMTRVTMFMAHNTTHS